MWDGPPGNLLRPRYRFPCPLRLLAVICQAHHVDNMGIKKIISISICDWPFNTRKLCQFFFHYCSQRCGIVQASAEKNTLIVVVFVVVVVAVSAVAAVSVGVVVFVVFVLLGILQ